MKERVLAGLYGLADPRLAVLVTTAVTLVLAVLALVGGLFPGHFGGLLADPASGGGGNS